MTKNAAKGMSSAVLLSILIHAALFLLAGMLVVFTVVKKPEKKFEPPKAVERPRMKLKKPKVKLKKSSKPKSTTRIVTKANRAQMPDLALPEMSGMGDGLGDGVGGGFDMMPELDEITIFGVDTSIGNDLEGTFYDFNRRRSGNLNTLSIEQYDDELIKFVRRGWDISVFDKFYRSKKKLYATTIAIPCMNSPLAPGYFGEPDNQDRCWIVHYKGQLVHKDGIKFRFVGNADNKLCIRVDGKVVLDGGRTKQPPMDPTWSSDSADHRKWWYGHDYAGVGDLIELEPGVPMDMEIVIGERPGGGFNAMLCVLEEGVEYEKNSLGVPILPVFKTATLSREMQDMIHRGTQVGEVCVTNGPIFNDFTSSTPEPNAEEAPPGDDQSLEVESAKPNADDSEGMRVWTCKDGRTIEGEFKMVYARSVVFSTPRGKTIKIPMEQFSGEDLRYITLSAPPKLDLDLSKKTTQRRIKYDRKGAIGITEYIFTVKVKCASTSYDRELKVDYYAIGSEIGGNKYILLDKGSSSFVPSKTPEGNFKFSGKSLDLYDFVLNSHKQRRGERYSGFLITVTDERGKIIAHRSTSQWLYDNLNSLKQIDTGSFMDKTCTCVWPTQLKVNSGPG